MACKNPTSNSLFLIFLSTILLLSLNIIPGFGVEDTVPHHHPSSSSLPLKKGLPLQGSTKEGLWRWREGSGRRVMIGSTAPTCTYNECRGCRFKCRAEQVPVNTNDPVNSAYRYRCVCHK